jgi:hypothetical protein
MKVFVEFLHGYWLGFGLWDHCFDYYVVGVLRRLDARS